MRRSFLSWHCLWVLAGVSAAAFLSPESAQADDAVEVLKRALAAKDVNVEQVVKDTTSLKTLSDLRRAYFLSEWLGDVKNPEQKRALSKLRDAVGDRLAERIRASAVGDVERRIAACIMIAEIAERDEPDQRTVKYASRFSGLLVGTKTDKGLVQNEDVRVRQAALYALGKITPLPADAMPALRSVLKADELGPRRLAAYALSDLVKNAAFLPRGDEMATIHQAVAEAASVLRVPDEDEQVRGYCLQTILLSARIFTYHRWASKFDAKEPGPIQFELDKKLNKEVLDPGVQELLKSYREAVPRLLSSLESDSSPKIKLAALETISQLITARYKICEELQKKYAKDPLPRSELLKVYNAPDPIEPLLAGQWVVIPGVLKRTEDVRLKRGVMSLLERVAEDVEATLETKQQEKTITAQEIRRFVEAITPALSDPDRDVRWTAARTLRYISPTYFDDEIVLALGRMLNQRDPDLSKAAAITIEGLAQAPYATKAIGPLRSAIADRTMDPDNRIAAMKALVAIGAKVANQTAVNEAFPELTGAVGSDDLTIRREACLTLGQLGHPGNDEHYRAAINALKTAMRDDDIEVRLNASEAILSITPPL
jgi:HEAT repeat protein